MHQWNNLFQENYQGSQNKKALYTDWPKFDNEKK